MALSTAEAEFASAAAGGVEILGVKELMLEIGMQVMPPIVLRIYNKAAIQQIDNEEASANGKHVDIKLKFFTRLRYKRQNEDGVCRHERYGC